MEIEKWMKISVRELCMENADHSVIELSDLQRGFEELSTLASEEYGTSLANILLDSKVDEDMRLFKVGRLLGIALKQPFAESHPVDNPSASYTRANRRWELKADTQLFDPANRSVWQYEVLDKIREEEGLPSVEELCKGAQYESGFFWYLAHSLNKWICNDPEIREKLNLFVQEVEKKGGSTQFLTPQGMISVGSTVAAGYLIQTIPILTAASLPIVAGLLVLIGSYGLDKYCDWVSRYPDPYEKEN
jgi:hypothetical protein